MKKLALTALALALTAPAFAAPITPMSDKMFAGMPNSIHLQVSDMTKRFAAQQHLQEREILALLRDQDPSVRIAALKYVRTSSRINDSDIRRHVARMGTNQQEKLDVRLEAVKALYYVSGYNEIERVLFSLANKDDEVSIRVMAHKALHNLASRNSRVRRDLLNMVRWQKDAAIKKAGIWALWQTSNQSDVRRYLMSLVLDRTQKTDMRLEAVKSLYGAVGYSETRRAMIRRAMDGNEKKDVRVAAILSLSAVSASDVSRAFDRLLRDRDADIRSAAVTAAGGRNQLEILRFFHLGYKVNERYVSPIEDE